MKMSIDKMYGDGTNSASLLIGMFIVRFIPLIWGGGNMWKFSNHHEIANGALQKILPLSDANFN